MLEEIENEFVEFKTFMKKFHSILSDFEWELERSFRIHDKIYAKRICNLLQFRAILEFLKSLVFNKKYQKFLEIEEKDKDVVLYLIKNFQKNIKTPQVFFTKKFEEIYKELTSEMVKNKISFFMENYVKRNLKVLIKNVAKKNDKEIYEEILNLGWNVKYSIENENKKFLEAVYENGNFYLLFDLDEVKYEGNGGGYLEGFLIELKKLIRESHPELSDSFTKFIFKFKTRRNIWLYLTL
uniref:Uncharacterized protein n=1 Tax=Meloidogyne enterolobii TaxID=390850 RepID=A0A6V7VEZ7_MELEN|nr:unnamed protein product [Meloidogyne enterolobii]